MALFKIFKGQSQNLFDTNYPVGQEAHEGYAYFTPDDGKFYIDKQDANLNEADPNNNSIPQSIKNMPSGTDAEIAAKNKALEKWKKSIRVPLNAEWTDKIKLALNSENKLIKSVLVDDETGEVSIETINNSYVDSETGKISIGDNSEYDETLHVQGSVAEGGYVFTSGYIESGTSVGLSGPANSLEYTLSSVEYFKPKIGDFISISYGPPSTSKIARITNVNGDKITLNETLNESSALTRKEFAISKNVMAKGKNSVAEGGGASALGAESHAEGYLTNAMGTASHAEGYSDYYINSSARE